MHTFSDVAFENALHHLHATTNLFQGTVRRGLGLGLCGPELCQGSMLHLHGGTGMEAPTRGAKACAQACIHASPPPHSSTPTIP